MENKNFDIEILVLGLDHVREFGELISIFEDVFEIEDLKQPTATYLAELLRRDDFIAVVAKHNSKVVGGLTIYLLRQYYSHRPLAYLYDLAVARAYQRKGIGKQLISFSQAHCWQRGCEELYVQAEKADDHAADFYRSTIPTREDAVVQFSYRREKSENNEN